jgi:hypothetical protein
VLNAALRQAVQWEILVQAPSRHVTLPRIRRRDMQVLSVEQAKGFLEVALPTLYGTPLAVAITTGMRPSECIGLKWPDIGAGRSASNGLCEREEATGCSARRRGTAAVVQSECRTGSSEIEGP